MKDYNCSIYISSKRVNDALAYLQMRNVKYSLHYNLFDDEYEISTAECNVKILDACARRFSKKSS